MEALRGFDAGLQILYPLFFGFIEEQLPAMLKVMEGPLQLSALLHIPKPLTEQGQAPDRGGQQGGIQELLQIFDVVETAHRNEEEHGQRIQEQGLPFFFQIAEKSRMVILQSGSQGLFWCGWRDRP